MGRWGGGAVGWCLRLFFFVIVAAHVASTEKRSFFSALFGTFRHFFALFAPLSPSPTSLLPFFFLARRLMAATFHRREYCHRYCPIRTPPRQTCVSKGFQECFWPCYVACLRNFAAPNPKEWANLRTYALEATRQPIAKICAPTKSYYRARPGRLVLTDDVVWRRMGRT